MPVRDGSEQEEHTTITLDRSRGASFSNRSLVDIDTGRNLTSFERVIRVDREEPEHPIRN